MLPRQGQGLDEANSQEAKRYRMKLLLSQAIKTSLNQEFRPIIRIMATTISVKPTLVRICRFAIPNKESGASKNRAVPNVLPSLANEVKRKISVAEPMKIVLNVFRALHVE